MLSFQICFFLLEKNLNEYLFYIVYIPRSCNINKASAVAKDGREVEIGNIYTKWEKNLDQGERANLNTIPFSSNIEKKISFMDLVNFLLLTLSFSLHTQKSVHLETLRPKINQVNYRWMYFMTLRFSLWLIVLRL